MNTTTTAITPTASHLACCTRTLRSSLATHCKCAVVTLMAEGQCDTPEEYLSAVIVPSGSTPQQPHKCQAAH